jgi:hypothetical protein
VIGDRSFIKEFEQKNTSDRLDTGVEILQGKVMTVTVHV